MSRSSNKLKIECLMQYLPTLKRKPKRSNEEEEKTTQFRVNVRGNKRR
jgi:hypothetical protein